MHLALSFAFAVKHYLRGEDGVNYPDYHDVLPPAFARYDETRYSTMRNSQYSYDAAVTGSNGSRDDSVGRASPESVKPDATKRIRPKRSKQKLNGPPSSSTPLLAGNHRTVEFHSHVAEASLPLPLV